MQVISTKPETALKIKTRSTITDAAMRVVAGLQAVAVANNDIKLKTLSDVSFTDLTRLRENDFVTTVSTLRATALPLAAALASWGVTQNDIDLLDTTDYQNKKPAIRTIKGHTVEATVAIKANLNAACNLLEEELDLLMLPFKTLNTTFYGEYLNARTIVDRAASHSTDETAKTDNSDNK